MTRALNRNAKGAAAVEESGRRLRPALEDGRSNDMTHGILSVLGLTFLAAFLGSHGIGAVAVAILGIALAILVVILGAAVSLTLLVKGEAL